MPWIPDSRYWIPVFVSGTWILDSNCQWDAGLLVLYSGIQNPGFRIPRDKNFTDSGIRIPLSLEQFTAGTLKYL